MELYQSLGTKDESFSVNSSISYGERGKRVNITKFWAAIVGIAFQWMKNINNHIGSFIYAEVRLQSSQGLQVC